MNKEMLNEIIAILPKGKTQFHYFKDRYALMLLSTQIGDGLKITDLKKSRWAGLLNKPLVKKVCADSGDGLLRQKDINYAWQEPARDFLLTISQWGGKDPHWNQTTRKGYNLVLQLNFSNQHNIHFQRLLKPDKYHDLRSCSHPVLEPGERGFFRETLAWARIDLDFDRNEALIEEIQNDWLRNALWWLRFIERRQKSNRAITSGYGLQADLNKVQTYCHEVLKPYQKIWDEAMLSAAIDFIYQQLGISNIYYHRYESGAWLKSIASTLPPRSLYTDLPKRFCFIGTDQTPEFLVRDSYYKHRKRKGKHIDINWFKMELGE